MYCIYIVLLIFSFIFHALQICVIDYFILFFLVPQVNLNANEKCFLGNLLSFLYFILLQVTFI